MIVFAMLESHEVCLQDLTHPADEELTAPFIIYHILIIQSTVKLGLYKPKSRALKI